MLDLKTTDRYVENSTQDGSMEQSLRCRRQIREISISELQQRTRDQSATRRSHGCNREGSVEDKEGGQMGAGCSTESPQTTTYEKSNTKDVTKSSQARSKDRKQSGASVVSDGSVKPRKSKASLQLHSNPLSKVLSDQSKPVVNDNNTHPSVAAGHSEPLDSVAAANVTVQDGTNNASTTAPKISDEGTLLPRLASLPRDLQELLLGHNTDPSSLINNPRVIHLKVIAPGEECMTERASLWSKVFVPLRRLCSDRGYVLDIQDDLWLSRNLERAYTHLLTLQKSSADNQAAHDDSEKDYSEMLVDVLLVAVTDSCNYYRLPPVLSYEDYTLVVVSLPDAVTTALFHDLYANNENRVPPAYELSYEVLSRQDEAKLTRLVHLMMAVFERENKDTHVFNSDYYNQLLWLQQREHLLSESTVIVSRTRENEPADGTECVQNYFNQESITDSHISALLNYFEIECHPDNIFQFSLATCEDTGKQHNALQPQANSTCLEDMTATVTTKLERLLLREIDKKDECNQETVTGVPRSLLEELISQNRHYHRLVSVDPLLESPTLISLQDYVSTVSEMPIVVYAESGWGLSTMSAQLLSSCLATMSSSVVIYRFMGISPDSRTLLSTLLSIRQQLDTIMGPCTGTWCRRKDENDQIPAVETLLSDIVSRSTSELPLLIILEGLFLASAQLRELDVMTMTELLPTSTKLLVMTSDPDVARGLRTKMRDAFYVKASPWNTESVVGLFTHRMDIKSRTLTEPQIAAIVAAIQHCPLPMYATSAATLASSWTALTEISGDDLPSSLEGILNKLFEHLERCIPPNCFSVMMAYLTLSVGGISKWEMADLLSLNDSVLASIYSGVKHPLIHRAPPILWKLITTYLRTHLNVFLSKHFYTYSWASNSFRKYAALRYAGTPATTKKIHTDMIDYFMGRCVSKSKSSPGRVKDKGQPQEGFIVPQLDAFGIHLNVRKFMCLPFHVMNASNKNTHTLETYIFNLPWVEKKLDSTSVLQVLCDLEQAKLLDTSCSGEIKTMQQAVVRSFSVLQVQGKQIYKCLQHLMASRPQSTDHDAKTQSKSNNGLVKLFAWFSRPPASLLYTLDHSHVSLSQILHSPTPVPIVNAIVPVSNDASEAHVVVSLSSENEIRVINIVTNQTVRTLQGVDVPKNVIMLDSTRAVVLCNRELAVIDLDTGELLMKLRGVLNLKMPLFGIQCDQKVVALSRDRMVVNIFDIHTGGIVATFKAGETRFLDSLIISGDGKILVCGDETQKPFPLLVWSLEQSKLLHDIRMAQHEFITEHADITFNGQYLACLCREVNDTRSNFVVVYDLISGQMFKKFKMSCLCTAVSLASKTMSVLIALDTGQLAVWDLVLGSHKFLIDGAPVAINNILLTPDESMCLTTHRDDTSISSHTLSLWNLNIGHFEACHTFDCPITCAQFTPDGRMILVGMKGHPNLIRLLYVPEGKDLTTTKAEWETDKDAANAVFGDLSRKELVINMAMEAM